MIDEDGMAIGRGTGVDQGDGHTVEEGSGHRVLRKVKKAHRKGWANRICVK